MARQHHGCANHNLGHLLDAHRTEFGFVDFVRPTSGPVAVVANAATIRADQIRGGRLAVTRVVVSADAGAGGAFVVLYSAAPSPDRIIDSQTIAASNPAAVFAFSQPVILQEFESLTAVITGLGGTATNVYLTIWGNLLRPKSVPALHRPDTESVNVDPAPWDDEVETKEHDTEDSAHEMARPQRTDVY